jgi:hypothetical protein
VEFAIKMLSDNVRPRLTLSGGEDHQEDQQREQIANDKY